MSSSDASEQAEQEAIVKLYSPAGLARLGLALLAACGLPIHAREAPPKNPFPLLLGVPAPRHRLTRRHGLRQRRHRRRYRFPILPPPYAS